MILKYNESEQRMVRMVRPGYSLIEIMIAIAIVGVLFGGVMYLGNMVMENANRSSTKTTLQLIKFAVKGYQQLKNDYESMLPEMLSFVAYVLHMRGHKMFDSLAQLINS